MSIQLTPQDDDVLSNIDLDKTGTIVEDVEIFFDFLGEGLAISDKLKSITGQKLIQLDQLMSNPLSLDLKRPAQSSYPNINGLYLLTLSSGLVKRQLKNKKWYLVQNQTLYKQWDMLSYEQKYLNLLVTWVSATPTILDECIFSSHPLFFIHRCLGCLEHLPSNQWAEPACILIDFERKGGLFNLCLADMFGFMELQTEPRQTRWQVNQLKLTDIGFALSRLLYKEFTQTDEADMLNSQHDLFGQKEVPTDIFEYALAPYFPHWSYLSPYPESKHSGRYTLCLTIDHYTAQATFSVSHYTTLHELALFILEELIDFDMDHLYRFHYQDARCQNKVVYHPNMYDDDFGDDEMQECKCGDEISLQDINFDVGQSFDFVYDLGEQWTFHLLVTDFTEGGEDDPPLIIETRGEPPKQYGYYEDGKSDDDEEEDEEEDCELD
ncbi:hypothetical protein [Candidatus Albibeggiatoa sp. nov. NOAA]|uniref:IS1096 element passenger TnpR family protein n=1 Tax=Candidatus Albibeggiatoa sp. nov. NOAA TaxID=3162724 RepID=UPI0032FBDDEB|nr:plasmid pRiA4b ORF-3 family protein [Thiotrichaceae bacterium]